jgi:small subunit ribosomal protein S1
MAAPVKNEDSHQHDLNAVDEGYWAALLNEGEYARALDTAAALVTTSHLPPAAPDTTEDDWIEIDELMQHDEILELKVIGYNRGGLLVEWRSLRGFVPASQLMSFTPEGRDEARRVALVERVGTWLRLRVIELDAIKNRLILSERAAMVQSGTRAEILRRLEPGSRTHGTVTNLCDFGAFIDLGGVEGLIHISELSWGRVGHPVDLLERGQMVEVYVLEVDPDQARVALSLKRLHPDPWATVQERYRVGETVEGRITNVVDFGAFACIEEGLEGLIHFSELAEGHFLHPRNVVAEGDLVRARILAIDGRARRLGLSLRTK